MSEGLPDGLTIKGLTVELHRNPNGWWIGLRYVGGTKYLRRDGSVDYVAGENGFWPTESAAIEAACLAADLPQIMDYKPRIEFDPGFGYRVKNGAGEFLNCTKGTTPYWSDRECTILESAREAYLTIIAAAQGDARHAEAGGEREAGWLIERRSGGIPEWLYVHNEFFQWTRDSLLAIRFCRREDADQVAAVIGDDAEYVTEHQWGPDQ
jgi:hypothetical protein